MPFPEKGLQVQRRTVFRWNVDFTKRHLMDTIATLSSVQPRHPTSADPEAYGGLHELQMVLLTKHFR